MSRKEYKSNRRKTVSSVETLDDRVLLSAGVPIPATPAPAPSPVNAAVVERFEHKVERIDRQFLAHSKQLKSSLIQKTDRLEAKLASLAQRPQVQAQLMTNAAGSTAALSAVPKVQAVSNQLDQVAASFNNRLTQLSNSFEQQFGVVANPLERAGATIPASAFENHLQSARAGLTGGVTGTVERIVLGSSSTATKAASSTTTASTGTTTTSAATTGVTATQTFNNAFTAAAAPMNSAINSVNSTLASIFGAFQNQFQTSVTNLISGISTTPVGAFQPTVSFVSGNGVTFTGASTGTTGTTTGTTGTVGTTSVTGTATPVTITGSTPTATVQNTGTTGTTTAVIA